MKKIISVIGARPQFIKHEPLKRLLSEHFNEITVHTGQHYDSNMSRIFFTEMNIKEPEYNLRIGSNTHAAQTAGMMKGLEEIFIKEKPDIVIVYGDTNSTLAGALTAVKMHIDVAHIEAGMRSFNMDMPEEINRITADRISRYNFAPSQTAMINLENEGMTGIFTGDIMYDAFKYFSKYVKEDISAITGLSENTSYALLTLHRAYNTTEDALKQILDRIDKMNIDIVFPIHPRTLAVLKKHNIKTDYSHIHFIEPLGYIDMLSAIMQTECIITDSGGLQKEAYYAGKKCITIRTETEWPETVKSGANVLCPGAECDLRRAMRRDEGITFNPLYGNGNASAIITTTLLESL